MEKPAVIPISLNNAVQAHNTPNPLNRAVTPTATARVLKSGKKTSAGAEPFNQAVRPSGVSRLQQDSQKSKTKPISPRKLAANRLNAQKSTGARTARGKKASKFNAVRFGFFARHVVIPVCDGDRSDQQFARLLADLQQEFQPEGPSEEFWVVQILECMWRLRRANWAEKGSVQNAAKWSGRQPLAYELTRILLKRLEDLQKVRDEISTTGTLSPASYAFVLPLLTVAGETYDSSEPKVDASLIASLDWVIGTAEITYRSAISTQQESVEDHYAENALPPERVMNKILRYDRAVQKKLEWALQKLLESRQRRENSQTLS